jgi:hypothetical protein
MFDSIATLAVAQNMRELYRLVLVDTPLAPYFSENLTHEDLDEMNIEVCIVTTAMNGFKVTAGWLNLHAVCACACGIGGWMLSCVLLIGGRAMSCSHVLCYAQQHRALRTATTDKHTPVSLLLQGQPSAPFTSCCVCNPPCQDRLGVVS